MKTPRPVVVLAGDEELVSRWGVVLLTRILERARSRLMFIDLPIWRGALVAGSVLCDDLRLVISFVGRSGKVFLLDSMGTNVLYVDPFCTGKDVPPFAYRLVGADVNARNLLEAVVRLSTRRRGGGKRKRSGTTAESF